MKRMNLSKLVFVLLITQVLFITKTLLAQTYTGTLTASNYNGFEISCNGGTNGTATVTGGTPPYSYKWSNGVSSMYNNNATHTITGLSQGFVEVNVEDANGNMYYDRITLNEPPRITVDVSYSTFSNGFNTSCFFCQDGSITLNVHGGVGNYTYLWNDAITTGNRTNLSAKTYSVIIKDANLCLPDENDINVTLVAPERDDWTANGNVNTNPNSFFWNKSK